jgi:hypothetical protein
LGETGGGLLMVSAPCTPLRAARSALKIWGRSPADAVAL